MKHAAEVLRGNGGTLYAKEQTVDYGLYRWADSKGGKPPTLKEITRRVVAYTLHGIKHFRQEVIWKHGQRYIKGARKIAEQRRAEQKNNAQRREETAKKNYTRIVA